MDHQSLSRLRVWLQILLRALHPRIHGNRWPRIRAEDFREARRGGAPCTRCFPEVFLRVKGQRVHAIRTHCHWHGDRSLPARRERIPRHPRLPGRARPPRRIERFGDHEVQPDRQGYRHSEGDCREIRALSEYYRDHIKTSPGSLAGATRSAPGFALGCRERVARGGTKCGRVCLAPAAGAYRWRGRTRTSRRRCQGSRRAVVLLRRPVSDARFRKDIPALHLRKISAPGQAIWTVVRQERLRPGRLPEKSVRTSAAYPPEIRLCLAALGGYSPKRTACAISIGLGRRKPV